MNDERAAVNPVGLNPYPQVAVGGIGMMEDYKEKGMTLKSHKRLTDLAYRVKDFIDGNGGLTHQESCQFGQIMQTIIGLK
jgi:hypothetical protein